MQTLSDLDLDRPGREGPAVRAPRFGSDWLLQARYWLPRIATVLCVVGATGFVIVQIRPGLIFSSSTDVGGDTAAHIVAAYYLIHHLIPRGQISGWDPQWFGGFPLYVFYFPLPAVLIAGLSVVFHYTVAFKIVTVLGTVLFPVAAYLFGRLAGFSRPIPALMSVAMLPFIFNTSYTIDGGNLASTLAGEFSFTLSMVFAMLFLGVFSYALRTGRLRWLAALLYAATVLSHVVPALFAAAAAVLLWLAAENRRRGLRVLITVGIEGGLLSAFWLLRFAADLRYSSSMGYSRVGGALSTLFPGSAELAVQILAILGLAIAIGRRQRLALVLAVLAAGAALAFLVFPSGMVYNGRWLPFWYLSTSLLAAYAVAEIGRFALGVRIFGRAHEWVTPIFAGIVTVAVTAFYLGVLPLISTPASAQSFVPGWISWNYSGYEAKPGWGQYQNIVTMLLSAAKTDGCGRLDYEYSPNMTNVFGSTLVPMAFPYWTGGCIDSEEGLYYESSSSTPFHFLDQAELSLNPSNPVVGIPYQSLNIADGIHHLQLTGVKYFLANSPQVEAAAALDPSLVEIASTPASSNVVETSPGGTLPAGPYKWVLYEIKDSPIVTPLKYQPIVEAGMSKATWLKTAIAWYQSPVDWPVPITTTGPSNWDREAAGTLLGPDSGVLVGSTSVSHVTMNDSTISFNVTKTGVPVDVKVPYFPNWQASGATGPYLESPNLMVVVPTAHHVTLTYGTTTVDWIGRGASIVGLGGLMLIRNPTNPAAPNVPTTDATPTAPPGTDPKPEPAGHDFDFGVAADDEEPPDDRQKFWST